MVAILVGVGVGLVVYVGVLLALGALPHYMREPVESVVRGFRLAAAAARGELTPRVSVCVPAYQSAAHLQETLDSVWQPELRGLRAGRRRRRLD